MASESKSSFISRETAHRLLRDVRDIIKNPLTDNGIYYHHDEEDMLKGYAYIVGPSDTPYFGGNYFFKFKYPSNYPFEPPKVTYMTNDGQTRFNPNLYKCGKVCVSILNTWSGDKWSACQTIRSVLITLCSLLNETPFLNEPGKTTSCADYQPYQQSIIYKNLSFAVCDIMNQKEGSIPVPFILFWPFMRENFLKNYDKMMEYVSSRENEKIMNYRVSIYDMNTQVDYAGLKQKLLDTRAFVEILTQTTDTDAIEATEATEETGKVA